MMFELLVGFIVLWFCISSLIAYREVTRILRKYRDYPRIKDVDEKLNGYIRQDFGRWNQAAIIRGCFLRYPLSSFSIGSYLLLLMVLIYMKKIFNFKWMEIILNNFNRTYGKISFIPFLQIQEQFDPSERRVTTPISISNHVQWLQEIYLLAHYAPLSIVAKIETKKMPVVASVVQCVQAIFVDRSSEEAKKKVFGQIAERVKAFKADPINVYPLHIFAQGTASNGHSILSFKNGPFESLSDITIFSLQFECAEFDLGMDQIPTYDHYFLSFCLRPKLIVKKKVVSALQGESVQQYRERCRLYLSEMTGYKRYDCDYQDIQAYEKEKKLLMAKKKI